MSELMTLRAVLPPRIMVDVSTIAVLIWLKRYSTRSTRRLAFVILGGTGEPATRHRFVTTGGTGKPATRHRL
jgi:hypothetical protein